MTDLTEGLNPQQKAAVTLPERSALVLAGAGSGKTRVLTHRAVYIMQNRMAQPSEIMAVTFTNKAAKEMLARISALVSVNPRHMWIGTFHGLCSRMLRLHHEQAGLPATFVIMDSSEQLSVIKRIMKANNVSDKDYKPRDIQSWINNYKEEGIRSANVLNEGPRGKVKVEIYRAYEILTAREGLVDFAELLLRSYELLTNNEIIRHHYQDRFAHILVDEFQDTNRLQYRWLKLLSGVEEPGRGARAVMFAVGDDDQSIYAFRGANVGNMQDFVRDFQTGEPIRLEQNYRSLGNILDAANHLISNNRDRLGKNLWTEAGKGDLIKVYGAERDIDEAAFVVKKIQAAIANGIPPKEIAVLYRSNAQSRVIEQELARRGIAYVVYGGLRFFDRAEVKNACAYLRLVDNPSDDAAFLRVVNVPARGIGAKTISSLVELAKANELPLYEACSLMTGAAAKKLLAFTDLIEDIRSQKDDLTLSELTALTIDRSGLVPMYRAELGGEERIENLEEFISAAKIFEVESAEAETTEDYLLSEFLANASLESGEAESKQQMQAVQLMTVHAAKGLEFDTVFITGLEEGLFPHFRSAEDPAGLAEERRLMYVAITRAKKRLFLTYAMMRLINGATNYSDRSSFFRELPRNVLQWLNEDDKAQRTKSDYFSGVRKASQPSFNSSYKDSSYDRIKTSSSSKSPYKVGQKVSHEKFGQGKILSLAGEGEALTARIQFAQHGIKNMLMAIASKKMTFY